MDVGASVSRTFREVTDPQHQSAARKVRAALSTYNDVADVIRVGAYTPGTSKQVDRAIELLPAIELFLRQDVNLPCPWNDTQRAITQLAAAWPF
ncbi:MAG: hypothetical protein KDA59_07315 [Planctomycetales bacterium]|nr:hypothetical protein [Planctomycetales bacterium]